MVDESLLHYLHNKLPELPDLKENLRLLISYEDIQPFPREMTGEILQHIDRCRILDPACGSGAFPMGILHKLVHIISKLDPDLALWENLQILKIEKLIETNQ